MGGLAIVVSAVDSPATPGELMIQKNPPHRHLSRPLRKDLVPPGSHL